MLDLVLGEQRPQAAVMRVGPRVVGLQPRRSDAVAGEEDQGALDEGRDGVGAFVALQLAVSQPRVIVDDRGFCPMKCVGSG
jgi:hypothetical protein